MAKAQSQASAAPPTYRLAGRTALITGGRRGIGRAIAEALASEGALVHVTTRSRAGADPCDGIKTLTADPASSSDMADAVGAAGAGKGLDLCVANAGTARYEDFLRSDECSWEALWRANVQSVLVTLQAAARDMRKHGRGGRLLVNASVTGVRGAAGMPAYSATKGALLALVEALALDLAPHRIFVNALVPGVTDTELLRETIRSEALAQATSEAALLDEAKHRIPLGRLARPYDIAQLALFLLNDTSSYITGTQVRIDGGLLLGH